MQSESSNQSKKRKRIQVIEIEDSDPDPELSIVESEPKKYIKVTDDPNSSMLPTKPADSE